MLLLTPSPLLIATAQKFLVRLKTHLLPRIIDRLIEEAERDARTYGYALPILQQLAEEDLLSSSEANVRDRDRILIEKDRLYRHEILNVNFTTYEGRRDQDILNPNTSRRDFMCLREDEPPGSDSLQHRFCYGRLLGIYHVNVVYQGRGALDRKARRFDVLWVRWYQELEDEMRWSDSRLDRLSFYALDEINATDFLDPAHVLRACHVIPRFSLGKVVGRAPEYSPLTKASDDWVEYVINR